MWWAGPAATDSETGVDLTRGVCGHADTTRAAQLDAEDELQELVGVIVGALGGVGGLAFMMPTEAEFDLVAAVNAAAGGGG